MNDDYYQPQNHGGYINALQDRLVKYLFIYSLAKKVYKLGQALEWYILKFVGVFPSQTVRIMAYRLMGMKTGQRTVIFGGVEVRCPKRISIGHDTVIGHGSLLDGRRRLEIGNNVTLSSAAWIWTGQHDVNDPYFRGNGKPVMIEDYAWISSRATVLAGSKIGRGAVVCAGAVVTQDIPAFKVVGGVPARIIGERNTDLRYVPHDIVPMI
ncbi:MAG: acyltransferase [Dehalococcoidia bacterium]|nr:acyltransferase [Dehalococcoidia bacterium]